MPNLIVPKSDLDPIETNLTQAMREEFEVCVKDEVPKLTNFKSILAYDYFRYGWEAAIKLYSAVKPAVASKFTNEDFTLMRLQTATALAMSGTDKQKEDAREFLTAFITRV
jgi:hypothetical protein